MITGYSVEGGGCPATNAERGGELVSIGLKMRNNVTACAFEKDCGWSKSPDFRHDAWLHVVIVPLLRCYVLRGSLSEKRIVIALAAADLVIESVPVGFPAAKG